MKPLVQGKSQASLVLLLENLAKPVDERGEASDWTNPQLRIQSWRGRRMPPFVGTAKEKTALALFLTSLDETSQRTMSTDRGQKIFEEKCSFCHGENANWPMKQIAPDRTAEDFENNLERLPEINPIMPPFEGTDEDRRALASYLELQVGGESR
jgi:mono/diheme cytochrome c family protein